MTRTLSALTLIFALLFLAGCKQADAPQTRLAEIPPDAGETQAASSFPETDAGETDTAPEAGEAVETESSGGSGHGQLELRMDGDVVEIEENIFVTQTNDIYLNPGDYMGKTISYEGIYKTVTWSGNTGEPEELQYVVRYGPGCCGFDGNAGFEVSWDGEPPQQNDWVRAVGVLDQYELGGWNYLILRLDSITVLEERGMEYVLK